MGARLILYRHKEILDDRGLDKPRCTIGRDGDNDIIIGDSSVSRHHAEVTYRSTGQFELVDVDSRNGTWVNGKPLASRVPWLLADGDVITFGVADVTLAYHDEAATRPVLFRGRGIHIEESTRQVYVRGQLIEPPLTQHQYRLLSLLVQKTGQVCTRDEIVGVVWPEAKGGVSDETIDALVKRLRQRLGECGNEFIITVPRHGYRLVE